jgi:hypothetical protein
VQGAWKLKCNKTGSLVSKWQWADGYVSRSDLYNKVISTLWVTWTKIRYGWTESSESTFPKTRDESHWWLAKEVKVKEDGKITSDGHHIHLSIPPPSLQLPHSGHCARHWHRECDRAVRKLTSLAHLAKRRTPRSCTPAYLTLSVLAPFPLFYLTGLTCKMELWVQFFVFFLFFLFWFTGVFLGRHSTLETHTTLVVLGIGSCFMSRLVWPVTLMFVLHGVGRMTGRNAPPCPVIWCLPAG